MNDPYRKPGEIEVDKTEIEKEKIRQAEETKRAAIHEREETKRGAIAERKVRWTDTGFQTMMGISVAAACIAISIVGGMYVHRKYPSPPEPPPQCVESTDIISISSTQHTCINGGWISTEKLNENQVVFRCHCTPKPADSAGK